MSERVLVNRKESVTLAMIVGPDQTDRKMCDVEAAMRFVRRYPRFTWRLLSTVTVHAFRLK